MFVYSIVESEMCVEKTGFVVLHTVPMLYEKHEDKVDPVAEKTLKELKKHYMVFDEKVLSKLPLASLKAKLG